MIALSIILGMATLVVILAAKRRKFRRYLRGSIDSALDIGTLAANTLVSVAAAATVNERTFISSVRMMHSLANVTPQADRGPLRVGIAHSDYTDAEIEQWIENTGSWNEGDKVSQEIAKRKIKDIGVFGIDATSANVVLVLNDGKFITTKLGWILLQGQTVRFWAFNEGSQAYATTAPDYDISGHANLWPTG